MVWISAAVGLATAGLAVLGFLTARVWVAARGLEREIARTRRRLAAQQAASGDDPGYWPGIRGETTPRAAYDRA